MTEDKLLEFKEVAERLHCSVKTIKKVIKEGRLGVVMVTKRKQLVRESELEAFLNEWTVKNHKLGGKQ